MGCHSKGGRTYDRGKTGGSGATKVADLVSDKPLTYGLPENQRKDFYYFAGNWLAGDEVQKSWQEDLNNGKDISARIEDLKAETKYQNILINENLPKLQGSEKQISWAEDIRKNAMTSVVANYVNRLPVQNEARETLIQEANKNGVNAKNINDVINFAVKNDKTYKRLKETTSAKEIIENRTTFR